MPLRVLGKSGLWIIGTLRLYTASGRWVDEASGRRGRMNGCSMRDLLEAAGFGAAPSAARGRALCPEAASQTQRMQTLYEQYQHFMREADRHTRKYQAFMRYAELILARQKRRGITIV